MSETKGFVSQSKGIQFVGARDIGTGYRGPVARVTFDKDWLHITTDDYEGHAMLNIEALSSLQKALANIAKARRAAKKAAAP